MELQFKAAQEGLIICFVIVNTGGSHYIKDRYPRFRYREREINLLFILLMSVFKHKIISFGISVLEFYRSFLNCNSTAKNTLLKSSHQKLYQQSVFFCILHK